MSEYKEVVQVSRIRRITGYLVGSALNNFNDAKYAEMCDRTKNVGHIGLQADAYLSDLKKA